jgi:hypothetical protein
MRIQCFGDKEYEKILPSPDSSSAIKKIIKINQYATQKLIAISS